MSVIGSALSILLGTRMGRRVRNPSFNPTAKRVALFWLLLVFYCIAAIAVARPADGKQVTMFIILFTMIGQLSMGLLLSFSSSGGRCPSPPWRWSVTSCCPISSTCGWASWWAAG